MVTARAFKPFFVAKRDKLKKLIAEKAGKPSRSKMMCCCRGRAQTLLCGIEFVGMDLLEVASAFEPIGMMALMGESFMLEY